MIPNDFRGLDIAAIRAGADWVGRASSCRLVARKAPWTFALEHAADIDAHWQRRHAESPAMFNGVIHVMDALACDSGALSGSLLRTDFKSYLYWRERGFPEAGVLDAFGSALIRSADGAVILGRQRAGHINAGIAYLPGGFIDPRDIAADGNIDIDASILRELAEETGLSGPDIALAPGYVVTRHEALLSLAREVRVPLPASQVRARIRAHIAADPDPELADAVIVSSPADLDAADVHGYARRLLAHVFAEG